MCQMYISWQLDVIEVYVDDISFFQQKWNVGGFFPTPRKMLRILNDINLLFLVEMYFMLKHIWELLAQ